MAEKRLKEVIIKRETSFSGKRIIGIDSGVLASIIFNEEAFQEYTDILNSSLFNFTHEECVGGKEIQIEESEVFKVLISKYKLDKEIAKKKIKNFLIKYNIKITPKNRTNYNLVRFLYCEGKKRNIEVHPPDVWIVADFKTSGVNLVYSNNEHFRKLCDLVNISAPYFPTDEKQTVDKEFFRIFGKRKFKKRI